MAATSAGTVAILTTATLIYAATNAATVRVRVSSGAIPVFLGPSNVTVATGFAASPAGRFNDEHVIALAAGTSLYGIAAQTGASVNYLANEA